MRTGTIGFVGLGEMGKPMAENLIEKGFSLIAYDIKKGPVEEIKALGATAAESLRDLAQQSTKIITMVHDVPQTEEVMFSTDGIWEGLRAGATVILMSTLDPQYCRELGTKLKEKKVGLLDACVSGFKTRAAAGTLSIMVGGEEPLFRECSPVFEAMGTEIYHTGGIGTGQIAKLANNLISYINIAGAAEGLALALKGGLDLECFLKIARKSTGNSWAIENWGFLGKRWREHHEDRPDLTFIGTPTVMDSCLRLARDLGLNLPVLARVAQFDMENDILDRIAEVS